MQGKPEPSTASFYREDPELRATPQESARPRCPIGRTEAAHPRALGERSVRGRQVTAGGLADEGSSAPVLRQSAPALSGR